MLLERWRRRRSGKNVKICREMRQAKMQSKEEEEMHLKIKWKKKEICSNDLFFSSSRSGVRWEKIYKYDCVRHSEMQFLLFGYDCVPNERFLFVDDRKKCAFFHNRPMQINASFNNWRKHVERDASKMTKKKK